MLELLSSVRVRWIRRQLLAWYDRSARDLPWRRRPGEVYAQWVAEIMLQQTRVETVEAYYERFLARFPTLEALAAATLDSVLQVWQGLGYYRRAENLHRTAGLLVERSAGWPGSAEHWQVLPGIGPYTAAAIASVSGGEAVAAIDGNVARVLARLIPIESPPDSGRTRGTLAETAQHLLSRDRPGDFNQAWMDLGATVCLPRRPRCDDCPLKAHCGARDQGRQNQLPVPRTRRPPQLVERIVAALFTDGRLLMRRRPRGGRWSGLWELPNVEGPPGRYRAVLTKLCQEMALQPPDDLAFVGSVSHQLTHRSYGFQIYRGHLGDAQPRSRRVPGLRWAAPADLGRLPIATAHRKILRLVTPVCQDAG